MKRKILKTVSVLLMLNILTSTLAPTIGYALTSGPTAPEYSTFEPVDTTNMVDLATGDFTYNIPLLEIPGPEGGYPLALSYHAGTSPDEEASWVGLGWNMNAGAINRMVSGFPDDYNNVTSSVYDYWSGGTSESYSGSVGFYYGYVGASYKLTYSSDTYKGSGWGNELTYYYGIASQTTGVDPYGNVINRSEVGISQSVLGYMNINASAYQDNVTGRNGYSLGASGNFKGLNANVSFDGEFDYSMGVGIRGIGASINSTGNVGYSAFGASGYSNKSAGIVNTISKGFSIPGVFSYDYLRYWTSEKSYVGKYGSLYYPETPSPETQSFDSYSITYAISPNDWKGEVDKQLGGSLPAYDNYTVLGQGIGGAIQPYIFDNISLFRQNRKKEDNGILVPDLSYNILTTSTKDVNFRFKYDFSNSLTRNISSYSNPTSVNDQLEIVTGMDNLKPVEPRGFNSADNHLAGSKHIEWFTVHQINDANFDKKGFIHESQLSEVINGQSVSDQIGGFMITNESGVTYHYGLPVYEFNEYTYSENNDKGESYRKENNPHPYAYTWLLTGITGPDFVDRGDYVDQLDANDWGYWVKFDYGKWTDQYKWRNPTWDYHKQLDQNTFFYSRGQKELYYLDAVSTRSHTAIFEKKMRNDSKGYVNNDEEQHDFSPSPSDETIIGQGEQLQSGLANKLKFPVSTLSLSNIYVFENAMLNNYLGANGINSITELKNKGEAFENVKYISTSCIPFGNGQCSGSTTVQKTGALPFNAQNVIDLDDTRLLSEIKIKALKTISFTYDYSLCKNTRNSFANTNELYGNSQNEITNSFTKVLDGKLTLKNIQTYGRGGAAIMPPTVFEYASGVRNPDYDQNKRDLWGMYKSDYEDFGDENLDRATSGESSNYVDAWSLTKIKSPLGSEINIEYESDEYETVALEKSLSLKIKNLSFVLHEGHIFNNNPEIRLVRLEFDDDIDLTNLELNSLLTMRGIARYKGEAQYNPYLTYPHCECNSNVNTIVYYWKYFTATSLRVVHRGANYLELDQNLFGNSQQTDPINIYMRFLTALGEKSYSCQNHTLAVSEFDVPSSSYNFGMADFIGGELIAPSQPLTRKGGGIRTRSISTKIPAENITYKVEYSYFDGATSYEPSSYNTTRFSLLESTSSSECMKNIGEANEIKGYRREFNSYLSNVLSLAPVVPGPGVIYERVEIRNSSIIDGQINVSPEYKVLEFTTPKFLNNSLLSMVDRTDQRNDNDFNPIMTSLNKVTMREYGQRVGNLLSSTTYDGNGDPLDKIENTYMNYQNTSNINNDTYRQNLETIYSNQGRIDQLFNENRIIDDGSTRPLVQSVVTRKEEYPNVLLKTKATNYKTGLSEETYMKSFDYYLGSPNVIISSDSYGNVYKTVTEQAYNQYDEMGLKVINMAYKHMLSQNLSSTTYKMTSLGDQTPIGLLSSNVQTWSNTTPVQGVGLQNSIWRKRASYSWIGSNSLLSDGTSDPADFNIEPFTYWNSQDPTSSSLWQKNEEVTRYNTSSLVIESKDLNSNYNSLRTDPSNRNITFTASNSKYEEMAYSGAEYYGPAYLIEGGVSKMDGIPNTIHAHSGNSSLEVGQGQEGFTFTLDGDQLDANRKYRASVWVYFSGLSQDFITDAKLYYSIGGSETEVTPTASKKSKNWYLINLDITPSGTNDIIIGCRNETTTGRSMYFDDFRVHPIDGNVSSFVYDQTTNHLTYIIDNDNLYTRYEYDDMGRLKRTYKEMFYYVDKKVGEQFFNYGVLNR